METAFAGTTSTGPAGRSTHKPEGAFRLTRHVFLETAPRVEEEEHRDVQLQLRLKKKKSKHYQGSESFALLMRITALQAARWSSQRREYPIALGAVFKLFLSSLKAERRRNSFILTMASLTIWDQRTHNGVDTILVKFEKYAKNDAICRENRFRDTAYQRREMIGIT